jgi:ribosomal 30S subunit maturation factor RimM
MNRLLTGTALGLMLAMTPAYAQEAQQPDPSATPPAQMTDDQADAAKDAADEQAEQKSEAAEAEAEAKKERIDAAEEAGDNAEDAAEANAAAADMKSANVEFVPAQKQGDWFASDMIGETVTNAANENIGDINDVIINEQGQVQAAVIGVGGFLGIGEKNVAVEWDSFTVTPQADNDADKVKVQLNATKETLEAAPAYARLGDDNATASGESMNDTATAPAAEDKPANPPAAPAN